MMSTFAFTEYPVWLIIVIVIGVFIGASMISAFLLGKVQKNNKYSKIPQILRNMNSRVARLAQNQSKALKKLSPEQLDAFAIDFQKLYKFTEKQKQSLQNEFVSRKTEKFIEKKLRSAMRDNIPEFLTQLGNLCDKHNIGLEKKAKSDFQYKFLNNELNNLKPMPNEKIDQTIKSYLSYSFGLHTILTIQQANIKEIDKRLSLEIALANRRYPNVIENVMDTILIRIDQSIKEYVKEQKNEHKYK